MTEEEEVVKVKEEKKTEYEIHTFPEEGGFCVVTVQVTTITLLLGGGGGFVLPMGGP